METPSLVKGTDATVALVPQFGMDGGDVIVVVIKQKFAVDRRDRVTRAPGAEVRFADEPWDEENPETSSVKYPSDVCLRKPSTDVLVVGSAMVVHRARVPAMDVSVRVGPLSKVLRAWGERRWERGVLGLSMTPPVPVEVVPLTWELAYGGSDFSDPKHPLEEPRNPVGRGVAANADALVNKPVAQVEDPRDLITGARSRPAPAGVGALGRHWVPRRGFVGTMDEAWKRERMPLLPVDFDERHNQLATPELITPHPLRGGEPVELLGLSDKGPMRFPLPRMAFFVGARHDEGAARESPAMLDTVLFEPNDATFEMTWRALVRMPRRQPVRAIQVHEKEVR